MAKIRSYTTIEQSKVLAEILPLESADMFYTLIDQGLYLEVKQGIEPSKDDIPCWSLAELLEEIPEIINFDDDESDYELKIEKENGLYYLSYGNILEYGKIEVEPQENFVDAWVALIEKLHELKLL